jgi:predicted transposase YbfD/YdcC
VETRRYFAFSHLDCLPQAHQWPGLGMFGIIQAERAIYGITACEQRLYIGSTPPSARLLTHAVHHHWEVENRLHGCFDVCLNDDQARARVKNAARNLATIRRFVLNLFRLDKSRKGGIKGPHMLASTIDAYHAQLLGLALAFFSGTRFSIRRRVRGRFENLSE